MLTVLSGYHGGLEYPDYCRFVGILGRVLLNEVDGYDKPGENSKKAKQPRTAWDKILNEEVSSSAFGAFVGDEEMEGIRSALGEAALYPDPVLSEMILGIIKVDIKRVEERIKRAGEGASIGRIESKCEKEMLKRYHNNSEAPQAVARQRRYSVDLLQERLALAVKRGELNKVWDALADGADADMGAKWRGYEFVGESLETNGERPLILAAKYGQIEIAEALLKAGANKDLASISRGEQGLSLCSMSALRSQVEFFEWAVGHQGLDAKVLLSEKVRGMTVYDHLELMSNFEPRGGKPEQMWKKVVETLEKCWEKDVLDEVSVVGEPEKVHGVQMR